MYTLYDRGMAKTIHITSNALWRREGDGIVILEEVTGEPYHLDEYGADVFEALQKGPTLEELVAYLLETFDGEEAVIRDDIELFLRGLLELNLIETREN